jgi:hypothetical protein
VVPGFLTRAISRREITDIADMLEGRIGERRPVLFLTRPATAQPFIEFFKQHGTSFLLDKRLRDACFYLAMAAACLFPKEDYSHREAAIYVKISFGLLEAYDEAQRNA